MKILKCIRISHNAVTFITDTPDVNGNATKAVASRLLCDGGAEKAVNALCGFAVTDEPEQPGDKEWTFLGEPSEVKNSQFGGTKTSSGYTVPTTSWCIDVKPPKALRAKLVELMDKVPERAKPVAKPVAEDALA